MKKTTASKVQANARRKGASASAAKKAAQKFAAHRKGKK